MKCDDASKFHRKSGGAKWRDLQFRRPLLEMFFDRGYRFGVSDNGYRRWIRAGNLKHILLPAPAESPVKLYQTLVLTSPRLGERQFFGIQRTLAVQHFKVGRGTALVAHVRQADRLL